MILTLMLIVGLLNLSSGFSNLSHSGNINEAIGGFIIAFVLITLFFINIIEEKKSKKLLEWAVNNKTDIFNGVASYNGILIEPSTELVRYQICMSFLIVTYKSSSRYYIRGYNNTKLISSIFCLASLLFGWWGLPWGPIRTVQAVAKNIMGGESITIRSIFPIEYSTQNNIAPIFRD